MTDISTTFYIKTSRERCHDAGYWTSHSTLKDALKCARRVMPCTVWVGNFDLDTAEETLTKIAVYANGKRTWRTGQVKS